jgi:hypothetical protein
MHSNRDAQEIALRRGDILNLVMHERPGRRPHGGGTEKADHVRHTPNGFDPDCRAGVICDTENIIQRISFWGVQRVPRIRRHHS